MFKEIASGFNKFFGRKEFILVVVVLLLFVALLSYSNSKSFSLDGLQDGGVSSKELKQPSVLETSAQNIVPAPDGLGSTGASGSYSLKPVNNPSDLLPSDANSEWARLNPALSAGATPDLLQAGYHIGLDTIGQTLRNANLQLRSDPIIPKVDVGPWNQTTMEPDLGRVPLEIGYGCAK
jgi:hypothetical protein